MIPSTLKNVRSHQGGWSEKPGASRSLMVCKVSRYRRIIRFLCLDEGLGWHFTPKNFVKNPYKSWIIPTKITSKLTSNQFWRFFEKLGVWVLEPAQIHELETLWKGSPHGFFLGNFQHHPQTWRISQWLDPSMGRVFSITMDMKFKDILFDPSWEPKSSLRRFGFWKPRDRYLEILRYVAACSFIEPSTWVTP